jgi:prephenate dehydrogenase
MTVHIAIIGLGQVGTSIGLALAGHTDKVTRLGHDRDPLVAKEAQKKGAVDQVFFNLPAAVEKAEIILLTLPLDQIHSTLEVIAPCLQENAVIMDTAPVKQSVAAWMKELLPPDRHYVGLVPAINPLYLHEMERGIQGAHADLFGKGLFAIAAPQGTVGAAIKLAADLVALLGAVPFFMDLAEVDTMTASLHLLPQLTAASLSNFILKREDWLDARKLAGRFFAEASALTINGDEEDALVEAVVQNRENVIRNLDGLIAGLEEIRDTISSEKQEDLARYIRRARQGITKWLKERNTGDWKLAEAEKLGLAKGSLWKRLFGDLGKLFAPPRAAGEDDKN